MFTKSFKKVIIICACGNRFVFPVLTIRIRIQFLLDRDPYKTNTVRIRNTAHKVVILCVGKAEDSGGGSEAGAGG